MENSSSPQQIVRIKHMNFLPEMLFDEEFFLLTGITWEDSWTIIPCRDYCPDYVIEEALENANILGYEVSWVH